MKKDKEYKIITIKANGAVNDLRTRAQLATIYTYDGKKEEYFIYRTVKGDYKLKINRMEARKIKRIKLVFYYYVFYNYNSNQTLPGNTYEINIYGSKKNNFFKDDTTIKLKLTNVDEVLNTIEGSIELCCGKTRAELCAYDKLYIPNLAEFTFNLFDSSGEMEVLANCKLTRGIRGYLKEHVTEKFSFTRVARNTSQLVRTAYKNPKAVSMNLKLISSKKDVSWSIELPVTVRKLDRRLPFLPYFIEEYLYKKGYLKDETYSE